MQHLCHSEDTQWITPWHGLHPCYTTFISHTLPLFYLFPTLIYLIYHICRRAEAIDDEDEDEDVDVDDESLQSHSSFYLSAFIYTIYIIIALSPLLMLLLLYTKHSHDEIISYPYMWISTSIHAGMWMMGAIIVWMGQLLTPTSSPSVSLLLWILRIFTLLSSISWLPHIVSFIIAISTSHDISHDSINHIPLWLYIETMVIYGLILMITLMMWKVLPRVIQDDNDVDASIQSGYVRIPTTRTIHVTPMTSPEDNASILSRLTFSYLASFITYVSRRRSPLKVTHLPPASYVDDIYVITHDLASQWKQGRRDAKHISLLRVLWWTYRSRLIINWLWLIPSIVLRLSGPFLLQRIISFHDDLSVPTYVGYLFVLALFLCPTIDSICSLRFGYNLDRMGLHVRTALTMMIYEKACKLPVAVQMEQEEDDDDDDNKKVKKKQSSDQSNPGAMINLISVDADRIKNTFYQLHTVVEVPVILIAGIVYLYLLLGWSMFVGIGLLLLLTPINWLFASCGSRIYRTFMTVRDIRMNLFHELLLAIKMLKVAGWEEMMQEKVMNARNSEMIQVRRRGLLTGLTRFYYQMIPTWVTASVLSVYAITRADQMNAATVFTAISLFGIMQSYISALPSLIPAYVEATIASSRLESFLLLNEVDVRCDDDDVKREGKSIVVQDASWTWYKIVRDDGITIHDSPTSTESLSTSLLTIPSPPIALSHINLHIPQGALVVVIGAVGSGKSCLLQALAGELHLLEGRISISHNIAYTPQQPYLRNATLRDNICFAHEYEPERYTHVIEICGLQPDIERMPGKDMCEIGEKGINLSGGQKQRVSLARALYANASIYLLDDPLSALDADVSYHVFQHAILHHLHHTTRILVTHAVQLVAKHADYIIIMKHGMIYAQGTYEEMIKQYPYEMHHTMKTTTEEKQSSSQQSEDEKKSDPDVIDAPVKQDTPSSIISTEDQSFGLVHLSTYIQYSTSMGIPLLIVALILQICQQGCDFMINWWLTQWTDDTQHIHPTTYYIIIYTSLTALSAILILAYQTSVVYCGYRTSHHFHTCALDAVIAAPLQWFDSTPVGRLLSRFSRDLDVIDDDLQFTIALLWTTICQCIAVLIAITYVTPFFLITAIPLTCIYLSIQSSYRPASRELNRLVNVARSPVYALITETTSGLDTIRCYTNQYHITHHTTSHLMIDRLRELITQHMKTLMLQIALKRWLQWRLQIIGTLVSVIAALLCVWSRSSFPLSSSLVGLSLSYASSLTSAMTWLINQVVWTETEMNSVERFISLTHVTPEDLEQHVKNDVDQHWPQYGTIRFENVTMSYHPHVPNPRLILNNLTFTIPSSTRIGVVGRTGSGKSSLISCLFRIVPPLIDGRIIIDDVDIATVPLRVLRSRMSLISQDPLLLNGTIRTNLDPTNRYINDDQRLWHVLEKVEMRSFVESHDKGLDMPITQSGANLSVGQRQLVCLARALLHPRRILVMDECTASIDTHTATSIQHTLHQMYASCAVITIAHRLSTIMSHDVIMVMDHGHIVEMDTPATLVANPNSYFSRLVEHSHQ